MEPAKRTLAVSNNLHLRRHLLAVVLLLALSPWLVVDRPSSQTTSESPLGISQIHGNQEAAGSVRRVQTAPESRLSKGKLLVASTELGDQNFAETVVLLTDYNEEGAMGIILNRATRIKLSELLPGIESLERREDIVYEGGPVERVEILMLIRAPDKPENSQPVFGDVYMSNSADLLKRLAKETAKQEEPFRVYSGYAGWAPSQLEAEVEAGAWHIFPATQATVFAAQPEDLWPQFIRRTTLRLALAWFDRSVASMEHGKPSQLLGG